MSRRIHDLVLVMTVSLCLAGVSDHPRAQVAARKVPEQAAAFADPGRVSKLSTAFTELDRLFDDFHTRAHVPGIAYGVVIDGRLAHVKTFGYRDLAAQAPVEANTVFRIASMTKSFTAIAILRLRDEGKLSLDDPAERYIPELKGLSYPTADSPRITIRHLLSHSAGFPEDNPWGDRQLAISDSQMSAMLRAGIPFSNPPGVEYEYSNYGFAILGRIVTNVSGVPYREYVAANILRPLALASTTLQVSDVPAARLAHGYRWEDDQWKEEQQLADGAFGSMGGMLTSVEDLGRYVGFLMSAWPPRDGAEAGPLKRSSLREMQQVWRPSAASVIRQGDGTVRLNAGGYAFGLRAWQTCDFRHVVAHSGGLPGFGSHMRWLPEYGVGIVALGNLTYTGWSGVTDEAFAALLRTGALQPRMPRPSAVLTQMVEAVSNLVVRWDDAVASRIAADNFFLDVSKDRRRQQFADVRSRMGACLREGDIDVENALRGEWTMACQRGRVRVSITLAPTIPPKVQFLAVTPIEADDRARAGACR